jgi:hypothetical protein
MSLLPFQFLNRDLIQRLRSVATNDALIHTAMQTKLESLLSGGVVLKGASIQDEEFQTRMWEAWIHDALPWLWTVGFCATQFEADEKHEFVARVLDITMVQIMYDKDPFGHARFRYFRQLDGPTLMASCSSRVPFGGGEEIENVFTVFFAPPEKDGSFRSEVMRLLPDIQFETHLANCTAEADQARSSSLLVTEKQEKINPNDVDTVQYSSSSRAAKSNFLGSGETRHPMDQPYEDEETARRLIQQLNRSVNSQVAPVMPRHPPNHSAYQILPLEIGRKLARQVLPEPPTLSLFEFRQLRRDRVFEAFGVPRGMMEGTAQGKPSGGGGGGGAKKPTPSSGASNIEMMFLNSQRVLQKRVCTFIETMYRSFYFGRDLLHAFEEKTKEGGEEEEALPNIEQLMKECTVEISLPMVPNHGVLVELYEKGWLKETAFKEYMCKQFNIPLDSVYDKPKLTLKEANGIQPAPAKTASASKK